LVYQHRKLVFNETVKPLAYYLKTLVYCPDPSSIKKNLPVAFRAYYSHVCAIINAFEIEIEKPYNSVQQALTWSEYKKCNTLKYLIACAPDGFIIFISSGYGGRISDTLLFQESKIMHILLYQKNAELWLTEGSNKYRQF